MLKLPRAILFDLDDTILTEGERLSVLLQVAEQLRDQLVPWNPVEVAHTLETALQEFWSTSANAKIARLGSHFGIKQARQMVITDTLKKMDVSGMPEVALAFCDLFTTMRSTSTRMFDGARSTLQEFRRMGVRLALVTNGAADMQRQKLARFDLTELFDHIQIEGELGFGKPENRAYIHAMDSLKTVPAETWMVGDNLEWEVAAPQRLGIFAIWHDNRGGGLPPESTIRPDRIIRQISELLLLAAGSD
jgi:putative hydrolase of the HAD superfamily